MIPRADRRARSGGQPGECDGPLRYAMKDAQTGRRKSSRPGCMHLIWVRGCPPDPPGCQTGRSATGTGDVHAQGPASGLWATHYPSRPTSRLDHPRTAGGAQAGGSATRSTPSSGPGTGPGGPEDRAIDSDLEHDGQSTTKSVGHRRNSRALSAPFCSRTRKLPHKNCRTLPAIPADQVSIFCVSRVDSSATRAWRSRFSAL